MSLRIRKSKFFTKAHPFKKICKEDDRSGGGNVLKTYMFYPRLFPSNVQSTSYKNIHMNIFPSCKYTNEVKEINTVSQTKLREDFFCLLVFNSPLLSFLIN